MLNCEIELVVEHNMLDLWQIMLKWRNKGRVEKEERIAKNEVFYYTLIDSFNYAYFYTIYIYTLTI
jgi:hypothetical protein